MPTRCKCGRLTRNLDSVCGICAATPGDAPTVKIMRCECGHAEQVEHNVTEMTCPKCGTVVKEKPEEV